MGCWVASQARCASRAMHACRDNAFTKNAYLPTNSLQPCRNFTGQDYDEKMPMGVNVSGGPSEPLDANMTWLVYNYSDRLRGGTPAQWTFNPKSLAGVARPAEIIIFFDAFPMWHGTSKAPNGGPIPENWNVAFVDGHVKNIPHTVFMDQHPSFPSAGGRTIRLNQDPSADNPNL